MGQKSNYIHIFLLSCLTLLFFPLSTARSEPLAQGSKVTLSISNRSESTVCDTFIADSTDTEWGQDQLTEDVIAPGVTHSFQVLYGIYDILLKDCNGETLLELWDIGLLSDYELSLLQKDIQRAKCDDFGKQGMQLYRLAEYVESIEAFQSASACFQAIQDRVGDRMALQAVGMVYQTQEKYTEALMYDEKALAIARELGDVDNEWIILNSIGTIYSSQKQHSKAMGQHRAALLAVRKSGNRSGESITLNLIGVAYEAQGQNTAALALYEEALEIIRTIDEPYDEEMTLSNISRLYDLNGQYTKALEYYEALLVLRRQISDHAGEAVTLNDIGVIYVKQGRYAEALAHFRIALAINRETVDRGNEGTTINNIGMLYAKQGRFKEALSQFEAALTIHREMRNRAGESAAINNIGAMYEKQGLYDEAIVQYETALSINREVGEVDGMASILNNIGLLRLAQGDYIEALKQLNAALEILREVGDRTEQGLLLTSIGGVYLIQSRYTEAMTNFEAALAIQEEVGNQTRAGIALHNIGYVYEQLNQSQKALESYEKALTAFDNVRAIAGSERARSEFIAQYMSTYDQAIRVYLQSNQVPNAFLTSERGRARSLLDSLTIREISLFDNIPAEVPTPKSESISTRQVPQDDVSNNQEPGPFDPPLVENQDEAVKDKTLIPFDPPLSSGNAKYEAALLELKRQPADLAQSRNNSVLSLNSIQAQLGDHTTLVSYWMLGDKTLAFIVTTDDFNVLELPDATTDNIASAVEGLYPLGNLEEPHPRPLRNLYKWLVEPLTDYLDTPHVAIIPHQVLHYIPFAALTGGETYFGQQYVLSVFPSASVLPFLKQNAAKVSNMENPTVLVFGNPKTNLDALPAAEAEATAVADLFHAAVYTGTDASELQLRIGVSGTNILHLAAHGNYNIANPLYSAIALAESDNNDGLLETHEVFDLPLTGNDIVILSACETSLNELTDPKQIAVSRGDEIVGFTRAFFFAGAPTVISSLWNVNDAATEVLMVSFYKHWLQEGMSKAAALQAAQADVRANPRWASPFYWAGFVLNGHPN